MKRLTKRELRKVKREFRELKRDADKAEKAFQSVLIVLCLVVLLSLLLDGYWDGWF